MLEYGGGCPASLAAIATKKKKKFAGVKDLVSVSGAMHRNVLNFYFFFLTYKQTAVVICAIKHAIERAK